MGIKACTTLEELRSFVEREVNGSLIAGSLSDWEVVDLRERLAAAAGVVMEQEDEPPEGHHPACVKYGDDSQCNACNR